MGLHKFIIAWLFLYLGGSAVGAPALPAPKEGVAILVNDKNSRIAIDAIDGTHKGVKPQGRYELAPGGHTVRARLFYRQGNVEWSSNTFVDYAFTALAGTVLKVVCEETRSTTTAGTWKMLILDSATGTDVRSGNAYPPPDGKQIQLQEEANFRELLQKAELGDAEAQYGLGLLYEGGNGVDRDPVRGIAGTGKQPSRATRRPSSCWRRAMLSARVSPRIMPRPMSGSAWQPATATPAPRISWTRVRRF